MPRLPAPSNDKLPVCFGVSHGSKRALCRLCPYAVKCAPIARTWRQHRSLSEVLSSVESEMTAPVFDVHEIERVYDHEYRQVFGRRSRRRRTPRNDVIFGKLVYLCAAESIDPATYIAANMRAMQPFVADSQFGFQPNMLSGDRARGRYNAFIRHANRRYRRGLADVAHVDTELDRLRRELVLDETAVGELFVRLAWSGSPVSWSEAIEMADPSATWLDLHGQSGATHRDWIERLGAPGVEREKRLAQLRAAVSVAEGFEFGLADRIGVSDFSWQSLADLIVRTFDVPVHDRLELAGVPGALWR